MRKQTFRITFLALSVATCLTVPYVHAQTQGSHTPSAPSPTAPGMMNPGSPSVPSVNQPGSAASPRGTASGMLGSTSDSAIKDTDRILNSQMRAALNRNATLREANNSIAMSTNNGVVTLTGTVPTEKEKKDIENELQRISGVSRVQNDLQIAPRPSSQPTTPSTLVR